MKNSTRFFLYSIILLFVACSQPSTGQLSLHEQFTNPPEAAKPWSFWYWMYGAVSKEGITADLEAMKEVGLGGTYIFPIKGPDQNSEYPNPVWQLSPEWFEMIDFTMQEADRLGLKLGMHICDGFALAGGPWITPEESMQKVVWSDTIVSGGVIKDLLLAQPESYEGYYEDIAVFAYPTQLPDKQTPVITSNNPDNRTPFSGQKEGFRSADPCWIQYEYKEPFTCRNIEVIVNNNNYQAHRLTVMASDDGEDFYLVKQLLPARHGWQDKDANATHTIPPTTARFFRFYWDPAGSEPGSEDLDAAKWSPVLRLKNLVLNGEPRINQWEGKAGFVWRVAPQTTSEEVAEKDCIRREDMIDLTSSCKDGRLTAELPEGYWKILRMGHTSTGHTNATGGTAKGLECDKFSREAAEKQIDNWFGEMFQHTTPGLASRVLKYMHIDSWECGSQNWNKNFAAEFKNRRGYDLIPYLPLLAGVPIENVATSEKVLRDVRTTISELIVDVFFTVLSEKAKSYGCELSAECVAPTMVSDGLMHYQLADYPMGEFWLNSPTHDKINDMFDAISGAHIYGKKIIPAEGFTELRGVWDEHPAMIKSLLDRNYSFGFNKLFYHVYTHNPYMDRQPGMTLDGIGLFYQRDQTWWEQSKAFNDYIQRCQTLLQYGEPVVDIAVFTGEEIPRRSILPDRLVPSLPGIFGEKRVESERIRLENEGVPVREIPVGVRHSANMADPVQWIDPMCGYAYDSFNKDVLVRLAKVKDGRMVLPGGASYKVVVLPLPHQMDPDGLPLSEEVKKKIEELRKGGVVIPELPYTASDFSTYNLTKDAIVPEGIAWTHRRGEEADVYFIANQTDEPQAFVASLRMEKKAPELWNAVTGDINTSPRWYAENGRTNVSLNLAPYESIFIVFRESTHLQAENRTITDEVEYWNSQSPQVVSPILSSWNVYFPRIEKEINTENLFDWSKDKDEKIKYYSGTAIYKTTFDWNEEVGKTVYLNVGKVCNLATVKINGVDCGTVWTAPYQVDITHALKQGENSLEIDVVNTWANAIRGADKGIPPFEGIWTNATYRSKEDKLLEAGLFGSVELYIK